MGVELSAQRPEEADVAIIGAGIVGLAVAYRISKVFKRVVVIEKEAEPGTGVTSGQANVIHVVQLPFGSLKSRLARKGNVMYDGLCRDLGVKLDRMSSLLVVKGWLRLPVLFAVYLYLKLELRGQFRVQLMRGEGLRKMEPLLADDVSGGIVVHGYGTVDVESLVSRLREEAERIGVVFRFGRELAAAERVEGATLLKTTGGDVKAEFVVNAGGLCSDDVSRMLGKDLGRQEPGLGVMAVYSGIRLKNVVAPLPLSVGSRTKGGAIIPATDGTTIVGPTLRVTSSKEDKAYTEEDLELLKAKFSPLLKEKGKLVRVYTGVRPLSPTRDFIIEYDSARKVVNLVGIESPGLTAAPAIAEMVADMLAREKA
ncbi:MAG: FAD-dependent oxidoreductase [Nitrososphaerota archaeon]|nr:FAD-dependent oxidoreductase [Nitrososphaerota archaeon]